MSIARTSHSDGTAVGSIAVAVGPITALVTAGLLGGIRGDVGSTNVALVLAGVVAMAALAGRAAGITTALTAALSYNFFHTEPIHSLRINGGRDVATVLLLAGFGVGISEIGAWRRRDSASAHRSQDTSHLLERVVAEVAAGASADEVRPTIEAALTEALALESCRFMPVAKAVLDPKYCLPRSGSLVAPSMKFGLGGFELPEDGVHLEVAFGTRLYGSFLLVPRERHGSTLDARRAAIALADLYAIVCVSEDLSLPRVA